MNLNKMFVHLVSIFVFLLLVRCNKTIWFARQIKICEICSELTITTTERRHWRHCCVFMNRFYDLLYCFHCCFEQVIVDWVVHRYYSWKETMFIKAWEGFKFDLPIVYNISTFYLYHMHAQLFWNCPDLRVDINFQYINSVFVRWIEGESFYLDLSFVANLKFDIIFSAWQ